MHAERNWGTWLDLEAIDPLIQRYLNKSINLDLFGQAQSRAGTQMDQGGTAVGDVGIDAASRPSMRALI